MKIKWIGQSGYILNDSKAEICIDPYLSDIVNKVAGRERLVVCPIELEHLKSDVIICTHNHLDHLDPEAISVMNLDEKIFYAPSDCMEHLKKLRVKNRAPFNDGDKVIVGEFELEAVRLTKIINPKVGIPSHYCMFASNTEDPQKYVTQIQCGFEMEFNKEYLLEEIGCDNV